MIFEERVKALRNLVFEVARDLDQIRKDEGCPGSTAIALRYLVDDMRKRAVTLAGEPSCI